MRTASFFRATVLVGLLVLSGCEGQIPSSQPEEPSPTPTATFRPDPHVTATPVPFPTVTPVPRPSPTPTRPALRTVYLRNTYYYIADEADYEDEERTDVLTRRDGSLIKEVSPRFRRDADIEGTLRLSNGQVWNYAGVVGGRVRYERTIHPWGRGTGNCALVPFRTIAVDPKVTPFGSLVRVTELIGLKLPDGSIHDGYARANDAGGAIKGDRMDIFTGIRQYAPRIAGAGIQHLEALEVRVYPDPIDPCTRQAAQ